MKKTRKAAKSVSADAIAQLADRGKDVSRFFKGQGRMVQAIQRATVGKPGETRGQTGRFRDAKQVVR